MPKINVKCPVYKTATKSGLMGKSVRVDFTATIDKARLYADGELEEAENLFTEGQLTYEVTDLDDDVEAALLGHTLAGDEVVASVDDVTPVAEAGFYAVVRKKGVNKYRAVWFTNVLFEEPNDSNATKAQNMAYGTSTIVGTVYKNSDNIWRKKETFDTEAEAIAYLYELAGLPVSASTGISALSVTSPTDTALTLAPAFHANTRYYTCAFSTHTYVKVIPTAALHTIKCYVDDVYKGELGAGTFFKVDTPTSKSYKVTLVVQEPNATPQTTEVILVKA